ncbi:MAG: hypothetical protein V2J16_04720 [Thermoleophilia bacterium]|jgi:hypothetical protein|nr:hypothetical protein [Thermoleophilia bacterium]
MSAPVHGTTHARRATRRRVAAGPALRFVVLVALSVLPLGLCACGDEAATTTSAPGAPATARDALVAYLGMLERGQFGDLDRVATPRYVDNHAGGADTALGEVRLVDVTLQPEEGGERTLARMTVYVDPGPGDSPWGDEAGERQLFAYLVPGDDGGWLIDDFGTGP